MMRRLALASALFVAVGSAAPSMAVAGTATTNLQISSTVPTSCSISTTPLSFGIYNSGLGTTGTGTVTTNCTVNTNVLITLGQGNNSATNSSDTAPLRRLKNGNANYFNYTLYLNSGMTAIWTNSTTNGYATVASSGTAQSTSVYGLIPQSQNVPAGDYSDSVIATVTY